VKDNDLYTEEKKKALNSWEQDARQQLTASSEGMAGSNEGVDPSDHPRLGEIQRAKDKIGAEAQTLPIGRSKSVWSLSALPPKQTLTPRKAMSALCHVGTAPSWQELSSRLQHWSVQPCVRPVSVAH
jgi:hypothetical protein